MFFWCFLITFTRSADGRLQRVHVFKVVLLVEVICLASKALSKLVEKRVKSTHSQTIVRHPELD